MKLYERWQGVSQRAVDAVLCLGIAIAAALEMTIGGAAQGPWWGNLLAAVGTGASLWWRRSRPLIPLAAFMVMAVVSSAWLTHPDDVGTWIFALIAIGYALGRYGNPRDGWPATVVVAVGLTAVALELGQGPGDVAFPAIVLLASALPGYGLRQRIALARQLAERTHELEAEREAREQAATLEERRRIARELHDIVAHSVSVMVVQAGAARRTLDRDPERALDALGAVEATGRGALVELRRLLGLLRPEGEDASRAPQPGMAGLESLVDRARAAGLPVDLVVEGEPEPLASGVDLAAYRIVQEALTNTLKHAGPARARVLVRWTREDVELEVTDTGRGYSESEDDGGGHGIVGMRERVAMCGGDVYTGRRAGGGFEVRVRLPRDRPATEAAVA